MEQMKLGNITVDVVRKNIKNMYLRVHSTEGRVCIFAPKSMDLETIRAFALSKASWIQKQQVKLRSRERERSKNFLDRESHYFNGRLYRLKVVERNAAPKVVLNHSTIELQVRPETDADKRKSVLENWYRTKLKETVPYLIAKWEKKMTVQVKEFGIKRMKTRWGSCNRRARRIWLNLELAKKPPECLDYVVAHEMVHLLERNHNHRFIALMNEFLPTWRFDKAELNRLPIGHAGCNS